MHLNNMASMDRLIPPSQEKSLDMNEIKEVNDYQQNDSLNDDLRNFKSSTNLIKHGLQTTRNRGAGAEDKRVIFKDLPDLSHQVRIAEDDVDSVQHLDLSVLDDNDQDKGQQSQILKAIQINNEHAQLKQDQRDFKNKNLSPRQLLLRPNRSRIMAK